MARFRIVSEFDLSEANPHHRSEPAKVGDVIDINDPEISDRLEGEGWIVAENAPPAAAPAAAEPTEAAEPETAEPTAPASDDEKKEPLPA